jgi:hypothetical protein
MANPTFQIRCPPIGLQEPPCPAFTETEDVPLSPVEKEATPEYFSRLLVASMPTLEHPVRKIVFTIKSHDQGWASQQRHTYKSSWTWFEAGLERFDAKQENHHECLHCDPQRGSQIFPICKLKPVQPYIDPSPDIDSDGNDHPRLYHDLLPNEEYTIQRNFVADSSPKTHTVVWSCHDDEAPADWLEDEGRGRETATGDFVRGLKAGDVVSVWAKARFPGWRNHIDMVQVEIYWAV